MTLPVQIGLAFGCHELEIKISLAYAVYKKNNYYDRCRPPTKAAKQIATFCRLIRIDIARYGYSLRSSHWIRARNAVTVSVTPGTVFLDMDFAVPGTRALGFRTVLTSVTRAAGTCAALK
jgi:hypothetical protein